MSSQRYAESRSFHEESRRSTDGFDSPYNSRVNVPIQHSTTNLSHNANEQLVHERLRHHDTSIQWVNDQISGKEKFRVHINIEGFSQNEVNARVDGNKLLVYGEHIENKNDGTAKKIIEKSFELPRDVDTFSPHVTFPTSTKMQVDFPSRHSNAIVDDGRTSSKLISNYDTSYRSPPRFTQEKSSTEYTSTRKIGGSGGSLGVGGSSYARSSSPRTHSPYDQLYTSNNNVGNGSSYSSSSNFQSGEQQSSSRRGFLDTKTEPFSTSSIPSRVGFLDSKTESFNTTNSPSRVGFVDSKTTESFNTSSIPSRVGFVDSKTDSFNTSNGSLRRGLFDSKTESFNNSNSPTYTYRVTTGDSQPQTTFPSSSRDGNVQEKSYTETHHETRHRRLSPTTGEQSSHEVEHHRSGSPSLARSFDEDRFRSNISLGDRGVTLPSSSRNLEVREYSRRVGSGGTNDNDGFNTSESALFNQGFNSEAFYRSAFQPQVVTDDRGQKRVEMKLDVSNYSPTEIKVSVNGNDLIVQAEHSVERPPTSSTRAYFYKQITLPSNTDLTSLSSQYHPDGKLHITATLSLEKSSIRYN